MQPGAPDFQHADHHMEQTQPEHPPFDHRHSDQPYSNQHQHLDVTAATLDVEHDAIGGSSSASTGAGPQTAAHALPQAGFARRKCGSDDGSAGLPGMAVASLAAPMPQEPSCGTPQGTPRTLSQGLPVPARSRLHTEPAWRHALTSVAAFTALTGDVGTKEPTCRTSGQGKRDSATSLAEVPAAIASKPSQFPVPISSGNLATTYGEGLASRSMTSDEDRGSLCTSVSCSGRLSAGAGTSLLERGSMWATALKQNDPLASSASAAFMHLAALTREAQERHPRARSPQSSPRDANELSALKATEGLKWVAECICQWAEHELSALDRALSTSIKHAAVNLQSLVRLVL